MFHASQVSAAVVLSTAFLFSVASSGCVAQSAAKKQGSVTKQPNVGSGTKKDAGSTTKATAHPALTNPSLANKTAPDKFRAKFTTTKGEFVVEVTRKWSPNGADRFYNLVDIGYFKDIVFFRAVPGFMIQFGVHGDPNVSRHWKNASIKDDPSSEASNVPGFITFAKTGLPNSRSAQLFINLGNNAGPPAYLDDQGFTPFGKVIEGLEVVGKINTEYGENDPEDQGSFVAKGNDWILKKYPRLDMIKSVEFIEMN